jgi:RHS repeat-associated protein
LGNVRLVLDDESNAKLWQRNDYHAFGMHINQPVDGVPLPDLIGINDRYYNGKEFDDQTTWLDYGARQYDYSLGRWMAVDPMAEKYVSFSPYSYAINDPVMLVDPDGKDLDLSQLKDKETIEALRRILSTKEGFAFLSKFANKGDLKVGGQTFNFAENGVFSKNTITFGEMGVVKDGDGVRTYGETNTLEKDGERKIGSNFTYDVRKGVNFKVTIDNTVSTEKASGTIAHELTLHVKSQTDRLNSISKQLNNKTLKLETSQYTTATGSIYNAFQDHAKLVNGQAMGYLNIINQLDKLQKVNGTHLKIYNNDMKAQKSVNENIKKIYGL